MIFLIAAVSGLALAWPLKNYGFPLKFIIGLLIFFSLGFASAGIEVIASGYGLSMQDKFGSSLIALSVAGATFIVGLVTFGRRRRQD